MSLYVSPFKQIERPFIPEVIEKDRDSGRVANVVFPILFSLAGFLVLAFDVAFTLTAVVAFGALVVYHEKGKGPFSGKVIPFGFGSVMATPVKDDLNVSGQSLSFLSPISPSHPTVFQTPPHTPTGSTPGSAMQVCTPGSCQGGILRLNNSGEDPSSPENESKRVRFSPSVQEDGDRDHSLTRNDIVQLRGILKYGSNYQPGTPVSLNSGPVTPVTPVGRLPGPTELGGSTPYTYYSPVSPSPPRPPAPFRFGGIPSLWSPQGHVPSDSASDGLQQSPHN
jgi:hypothetical protein